LKITCVIPCHNEESTVESVVEGCRKYCGEIFLIDDGSTDETASRAAKAGAHVVKHAVRLGAGSALSTGFEIALRSGADIIVTLDGDGQHSPDDVPRVVKPILDGAADFVVGSRFLENAGSTPIHKKIGNKLLSSATSLVCGRRITDSQSGFRAYTRNALKWVIHEAKDYAWASETLILAARRGFRVTEVPIRSIYLSNRQRGAGVSDGPKILYETLKRRPADK